MKFLWSQLLSVSGCLSNNDFTNVGLSGLLDLPLTFLGYVKCGIYLQDKSHHINIFRKHQTCKPAITRILYEPMLVAGFFICLFWLLILLFLVPSQILCANLLMLSHVLFLQSIFVHLLLLCQMLLLRQKLQTFHNHNSQPF